MNLDFTITEYYDYEVDYQTGITPSEYRVELNGEILFQCDPQIYNESCHDMCESFVGGYVAATDMSFDVTHKIEILEEKEDYGTYEH